MGYRQLGRQLRNYEQSIPSWLERFFADYSADPYQSTVIDELQRRSADSFGRDMGQMASYFSGAGRMGGGMAGDSMGRAAAENAQRLRGDIGGLMSQDYQGHMQRMLEAAGLLGGIQQTGMGGMASGYGSDQARRATQYAADQSRIASMYNTDAYRAIGMGNLGMNKDFGTWDRQYRMDMMPYEQLNMLGQGVGGLMAPYGRQQTSGSRSMSPSGSKGGNMAQGALGGAMMGYGMSGGFGGGGGRSAPVWGQNAGFAFPGMRWR